MTDPLIRYVKATPEPVQKTEEELRQEIIRVCHLLAQKGLVSAMDGNVSARLAEGRFLCTPSGFNKGMLAADHLLVVDWDVEPVGPRTEANRQLRPSSEMLLHLEAYRQRPDIAAVVHAHPPTAVALSLVNISLAHCLIPDVVVSLGMIPTTGYATPSSREGARVISDLIRRWDALVLPRHGSVTVGNSPLEAYLRLEKLEQAAQMTKIAYELGVPQPLAEEDIAKLVAWRRAQGLIRPDQDQDRCAICGVSHFA